MIKRTAISTNDKSDINGIDKNPNSSSSFAVHGTPSVHGVNASEMNP